MSQRSPVRIPVWMWKALMAHVTPGETRRFNVDPIVTVRYHNDIDYGGHGLAEQRLDVIVPRERSADPLPVYVYFHGGGWTSGDKATLTKYCASQAQAGMVVVNANYRLATRHHMHHMLQDANDVLAWVRDNIAAYGGDPGRVVVGGDSAGGQIAALATAATANPELAAHYGLEPAFPAGGLRGLVQHCSVADFRVVFERGFIMGLDFVRMLLPGRAKGIGRTGLMDAAHYLSPVEWLGPGSPPALVTSSVHDFLLHANTSLAARLRGHGVGVDALFLGAESRRARHTWQQDARLPESQAVYRRLHDFVARVTAPANAAIPA